MKTLSDMTWTTLAVQLQANGVLDVTLNRAASRNAINLAMCEEFIALSDALRVDETVRVVVLRGDGPSFCAGVDVKELAGHDATWTLARRHRGLDAYLAVERIPVPVIAVVHGTAAGGGAELATACDFVIAADTAAFQWPEALRGAVGATQRLPRIVGMAMAKELLFTGVTISAVEAKAIGVVNRVVPAGELEATVSATVERIAGADTVAVRGIKQAMNLGEACPRAQAVDIERQAIAWAMARRPGPVAELPASSRKIAG